MVYYVDSRYGCDKNDGLTRQSAWESLDAVNGKILNGGDSVLFKAGCKFEGQLRPRRTKGEGLISISRYGVGKSPELISTSDEVVTLCDFNDVKLSELDISAPNGIRGIYIHNKSGGALRNIQISGCSIHDINTDRKTFSYESGGIICASFSDEPGWFENLLIEDNSIADVGRTGILLTSLWANRPTKLWGHNEYKSDTENWWPSKGIEVRGNYINRTGGDGIVIIGTIDAVIEWNTVYNIMTNPVPPCANAGIWPQSSNGCVMQYNEVGYCHKPEGCNDAQGFDVDLSCRNTLIQYNYSHDNEGGFLLLCEILETGDDDNFTGTVVRNNLSVNDGNEKGELIALVGPVRGVLIENNTIYSSGNVERLVEVWTQNGENQAKNVVLRNNIFVSNGKGNSFNICNGSNFVFENNLFWGEYKEIPSDQPTGINADPEFFCSGKTGDGFDIAKAYIPRNPLLEKTATAPDCPSEKDFLGRLTDKAAYIGAIMPKPLINK